VDIKSPEISFFGKIAAAIQRHSQVLLFFLVLFIGLSSISLGAVSIKRSIEAPFAKSNTNALATAGSAGAVNVNKDTDGDGLLDVDELGVYGTSPYLADSDSDGVPDGEEISKGSDPNCPAGKICTPSFAQPPAVSGGAVGDSLFGQIPSLSITPPIAELRNLLKQSGLPADQIDALSDEQILQAYNEAVAKTKTQDQSAASNNSAPASNNITNLTPTQIRDELIKSGVTKEQIENVSDEDLMRIYNETIRELQEKQANQ